MGTMDLIFSSIENIKSGDKNIKINGENVLFVYPIREKKMIDTIISTCKNGPGFWIEKNGAKLHETCGGYCVLISGNYYRVLNLKK